jgi:excisionase family DNA binding protein
MTEAFIPAAVLAERMGVSPDTVTRWCRQGRIPAVKPGRDWRVAATVAEDLVAARAAHGVARGLGGDSVEDSPWREPLEQQISQLFPGDHVLVVVPGGWDDARLFRDLLASVTGDGTMMAIEPPAPPTGGMVARTVLTAAARAQSAGEMQQASRARGGDIIRRFIRWTSQIPSETLPAESRVARLTAEQSWITFCILPLSGTPDLATLVQTHTHVLVGTASAPSWLGSARGSSWLGLTGMTGS